MGQSRDYVALDWIKSEIETTLGHARQALEAYADTPESTRMRSCLTYIHQVHGTLQMVELHGLAELSEEMEQLAQAMMNNDVDDSDSVHQVLMRSIVALPAFLERVRAGEADSAQAVRPLVNELRNARGASPLPVDESEASEPDVDLSPLRQGVHVTTVKNFDDANGQVRAQKVRRAFQQSLLALHRGEGIDRVYINLAKLFITLARLCAGSAHGYQWAAFAAMAEALAKGTLELGDQVIALLRRVDAEIKKLALGGHTAVTEPVDEMLMRDVLSVLATVKDRTSIQRDILERFGVRLEQGAAETPPAGDREAIAAAAATLREELATVLDKIDLFVRSQDGDHEQLSELAPVLKEMATTLRMTGLPKLQRRLMEQMVLLQAFAQKGGDEAKLMDIAAGLLRVDSSLERIVESGGMVVHEDANVQLTDAQAGVIREARAGLEQIKEAIVEFIASQWNYDKLADVPSMIGSVRGALLIIPVPRAAELLDACRKHVEDELIGKVGTPDWQMLDTLADAITSIDYYLERLFEDPARPDERILDVAAQSVAQLERDSDASGDAAPRETDASAPTVAIDLPGTAAPPEAGAESEADALPDDLQGQDGLPETDAKLAPPAPVVSDEPIERVDVDVGDEFLIDESFIENEADGEASAAPNAQDRPEAESSDDLADFDLESSEGAGEGEPAVENRFEVLPGADASSDDEIDADEAFIIDVDRLGSGTDDDRVDVGSNESAQESDIEVDAPLSDAPAMSPSDDVAQAGAEFIIDESFDGDAAESEDKEDLEAFNIDDELEEAPDPPTMIREQAGSGDTSQADAPDEFVLDASFDTNGAGSDPGEAGHGVDEEPPAAATTDADASREDSLSVETVHRDPEIIEIFLQEVAEVLRNLTEALPRWRDDLEDAVALGDVRRAFHTLKGSGRMVGASLVSELSWSIENMLNRVIDGTVSASPEMANLVGEVCEAMPHLRSAFENQATPEVDPAPYMERADLLASGVSVGGARERAPKTPSDEGAEPSDDDEPRPASLAAYPPDAPTIVRRDPTAIDESLLEIFEEEAVEHLAIIERCIEQRATIGETVVRALHNLKGSAAIADLPDVLGIAAPLEDFVRELVENDESDEAVYPILAAGIHAIRACLAALREGNDPAAEMDRFHDMLSQGEAGFGESATSGEAETKTATADHAEREATQGSLRSVRMTIELPEHVDPEVLEIFHEEAEELLESIDRSIQEWLGDRTNGTHLDALLRALHTLKGGARLAGLTLLGDYTHRFESHLIEQQPNVGNLDDAFFVDLQSRHDLLVTFVTAIRSGAPGESIVIDASIASEGDEAAAAASADTDELGDGTPVDDAQRAAEDNVIPFATREAKESDVASSAMAQSEQVPVRQAPQEMVRVASTLLDDLVNLAGETSIHRARVEQEIRDFGDALDETETTIERLRDQLRRLELETDAQVLSRRERADGPGYTEFDPLEMDRYSQLQQLSRSLLESATDLVDLKETLAGKRRDAEALLAHQARINTELQEGLMRTRMVPFERLVPRLRRIVRQIGRELNKDVTFEAFDAEGELDRNVLERMIPPLEHMLRNAVDHGIESPEEREAAGKPAKGNITLRLSREGGDIVMEIADDGRGVDVERVREKAVQLGLMPEDADLKDDDIVQFIMAPGFSTAESVTQISGRGVGMDVAVSEVKMLGGEISIASEPGKGAKFTVRLPFTVSVNRALMVLIGEDTYAIPLNTIEGIVRVLPKDLEPYLEQSAATFEYAGERYRMRYLGSYVGREQYTRSDALSVPVLLVRSGDEAVALYVDAVQGSREIVVKGLGPQFASVGGVSGATILGDGSVVVILDPPSLIRAELAARLRPTEVTARREDDMSDRLTRVMVVDDSVTVRKVTSRVLERNGFEVMLAKDGVDAIAMLHQRQPDIMLLDIEMPRMDGFEVARQVRRDDRLKNLPIVIISSRTGAKHQERARELGVNVFLGKPFQETELMRIINELVG